MACVKLWGMKAVVLYRPDSEHARIVEDYVRDFEKRTGKKPELLSMETVEGVQRAGVYDIMQYPAVVVTKDDGQFVKDWVGENLPLVNDVVGYLAE